MYHHIFLLFFSEIGDLCNSKQGEEWWTAEFCDWEPKDTTFCCLRTSLIPLILNSTFFRWAFQNCPSNSHFGQTDTVAKVAVCRSKGIRQVNSLIHSYFHRYEMRYWDRIFFTWKSFYNVQFLWYLHNRCVVRLHLCSSYPRCFIKAPDMWDTLHHINLSLSSLACIFRMKYTVKHFYCTRTSFLDFYLFTYWGHINICDSCCEDGVAGVLVVFLSGCL